MQGNAGDPISGDHLPGPCGNALQPGSRLAWVLVVVAALPGSWAAMGLLARTDRGLDFTDEGMYLLSADSGSSTSTFHNAFGRYTRVLFLLAGGDIARFRALGVLLLVVAAAVAGDRLLVACDRIEDRAAGRRGAARALSATAVVAAALHYEALMLVTPSYNLLNLVGLLLVIAATAELVGRRGTSALSDAPWVAVLVGGTVIATMGKVSSAAFGAVSFAVVLALDSARRRSRIMSAAGACGVVAALHSVFVNDLATTAAQIRRGQQALLILDPAYGIGRAVRSVGAAAFEVATGALGHVGVSVVLVVAGRAAQRRIRPGGGADALGALTMPVGLVVAWLQLSLVVGDREPITTAVSWFGCAVLIVALIGGTPHGWGTGTGPLEPGDRFRARGRLRLVAIPVLAAAAAGAYGFGSNNGFFTQMNGATGLLVCAAVPAFARAGAAAQRRRSSFLPAGGVLPLAALSIICGLSAATMLDRGARAPYRQEPLAEQTVPIRIGPSDGTLRISPATARFVEALRSASARGGWTPGTPLLDLSPYAATVLYLLDARPLPTIIPTVCCYEGQDALARWSLREAVRVDGRDLWRGAWVLWADQPVAGNADPTVLHQVGRQFPDDYERVGTFDLPMAGQVLSLWRPRAGN